MRTRKNRVQKHFSEGTGRTHQSFKDECDINTIMGKWRETGFVDHVQLSTPVYGDFATALDYQQAMDSIIAAGDLFDSLPARIRDRVGNDPAQLIAFIEDETNSDECVELGLKLPIIREPAPADPPPAVGEETRAPTPPTSPPT